MQINWVIYMHCNNHVPKKNYLLYKYYVHFLSTLIPIRFHHISFVTVFVPIIIIIIIILKFSM